MTLQEFLDQVKNRGNSLTGANDSNNPLTLSNSQIDAPTHAQGFWGNLQKIAQMRGNAAMSARALQMQDSDREMKRQEMELKLKEAGLDEQYKGALMKRMGFDQARDERNDKFTQADREFKLRQESEGSPQPTGKMISASIEQSSGDVAPYMRSPITPEVKNANQPVDFGNGIKLTPLTKSQNADSARALKKQEGEDKLASEVIHTSPNEVTHIGARPGQTFTNPKDVSGKSSSIIEIEDPNHPGMSLKVREQDGKMFRTDSGEEIKTARSYARPFKEVEQTVTEDDVAAIADRIVKGLDLVSAQPGFGKDSVKGRVNAFLAKHYPDYNAVKAEADAVYGRSAGFQNRNRNFEAIGATGDIVKNRAAQLDQNSFTIVNNAILSGKKQLSDPAAIRYDNALTTFADEIAQTYGGNTSDYKVELVKNMLNHGYSNEGIQAAVDQELKLAEKRQSAQAKGTAYDKTKNQPNDGATPKTHPELFDKIPLANGTFGYRRKP